MPIIPDDIPPPLPAKPVRLLDQLRYFIRQQNKAYKTEKTYVHWVKRYIFFHHKKHDVSTKIGQNFFFLKILDMIL